jgi:hypothetical protein
MPERKDQPANAPPGHGKAGAGPGRNPSLGQRSAGSQQEALRSGGMLHAKEKAGGSSGAGSSGQGTQGQQNQPGNREGRTNLPGSKMDVERGSLGGPQGDPMRRDMKKTDQGSPPSPRE